MPSKKSTVTAPAPVSVLVPEVKPDVKVDAKPEVTETETEDLTSACTTFNAKLAALRQNMGTLIAEFKTLQRRAEKDIKTAQKSSNRRRNPNRAPSGFVKPTVISEQLSDFLGKPKGTMIARTEVTREINAYIRANKLQDPTNGRKINPDAKLKKLLALKPTDELTYFNLQRYMSPHFQKSTPAVASS